MTDQSDIADMQRRVDAWLEEKGVEPGRARVMGYSYLGRHTMGLCSSVKQGDRLESRIYMHAKWRGRWPSFLAVSVLYHEAMHAADFLEDGTSDSHGGRWSELMKAKPVYRIGDALAKIAFAFMKEGARWRGRRTTGRSS